MAFVLYAILHFGFISQHRMIRKCAIRGTSFQRNPYRLLCMYRKVCEWNDLMVICSGTGTVAGFSRLDQHQAFHQHVDRDDESHDQKFLSQSGDKRCELSQSQSFSNNVHEFKPELT
jgi:hypothetical protein